MDLQFLQTKQKEDQKEDKTCLLSRLTFGKFRGINPERGLSLSIFIASDVDKWEPHKISSNMTSGSSLSLSLSLFCCSR